MGALPLGYSNWVMKLTTLLYLKARSRVHRFLLLCTPNLPGIVLKHRNIVQIAGWCAVLEFPQNTRTLLINLGYVITVIYRDQIEGYVLNKSCRLCWSLQNAVIVVHIVMLYTVGMYCAYCLLQILGVCD
jgi:hypothetical protein